MKNESRLAAAIRVFAASTIAAAMLLHSAPAQACAYPTPPPSTALTATQFNSADGTPQVQFDWRAGEEGDCQATNPVTVGYWIEYGLSPGAADGHLELPIGSLGGRTTYTLALAGITGTFYIRVRGVNGFGPGTASNEVILNVGSVAGGAPATPANVTGTANGSSFVLVWGEVSPLRNRATSFSLTVSPPIPGLGGNLGAGAPITTSGGSAIGLYRASGVPGGVYTFQVQARNSAGSSASSPAVTLTLTGPTAPIAPTALHGFSGVPDGGNFSTVTAGSTEVYGTTSSGGLSNRRCVQDRDGCGTVFATSTSGVHRILHSFNDADLAPGGSGKPATYPRSQLLLATDGNLWGTTVGQEFTNPRGGGAAVVYKVNPTSGATTIVAELGGPSFSRVFQANGRIYGTTQTNGPGSCGYQEVPTCLPSAGSGTVWYVPMTGGPATYIHTFTGPDGANPYGGVMLGADGMLYGMTSKGGSSGFGTIYRVNPADNSFTKIYDWPGGAGGSQPLGELIQVGSTFYGTTECGGDLSNTPIYCSGNNGAGAAAGKGTIFSMTVSGNTANVNIMHAFTGRIQETGEDQLTQAYDGVLPTANLTVGPDGRLYGVTNGGGSFGAGTAFAITTGGGFTQLYTFGGGAASGGLNATLVLLGNVLIGSGQYGGQFNYGAVYYFTAPSGFPTGR